MLLARQIKTEAKKQITRTTDGTLGQPRRTRAKNGTNSPLVALTLSSRLPLSLGGQILLQVAGSDLVLLDLLAAQSLDLLEELGDLVGHGFV